MDLVTLSARMAVLMGAHCRALLQMHSSSLRSGYVIELSLKCDTIVKLLNTLITVMYLYDVNIHMNAELFLYHGIEGCWRDLQVEIMLSTHG